MDLIQKEQHKALLLFWILLTTWLVAYYPTITTITDEWLSNGPYSHGFLALAISVYLIWQRRTLLMGGAPEKSTLSNWLGFFAVAAFGFGWWLGEIANVLLVQQFSVVMILAMLILTCYGWQVFRRLLFAMTIIVLVLPIWDFLQGPLRDISTIVSYQVIKLIDIPILLEGYHVTVPGGRFVVEKACAGLSFFLCALLLSLFFIYSNHVVGIKRLYFVLFGVGLAIVANWIRIILIIVVGNYTQMQHIIVQDHLTFGWIVYALTLIPFFWVGNRFFANDSPQAIPDNLQSTPTDTAVVFSYLRIAAWMVALLFPIANTLTADTGVDENYGYTPPNIANRELLSPLMTAKIAWRPQFRGASSEQFARYYLDGQELLFYVANYHRQTQGKELIFVENSLFEQNRWPEVSEQRIKTDIEGVAREIQLLFLRGGYSNKRIIGYWYNIAGQVTANQKMAKIYEVLGVLTGNRGASIIAIAIDYSDAADDQAVATLKQFIALMNQSSNLEQQHR